MIREPSTTQKTASGTQKITKVHFCLYLLSMQWLYVWRIPEWSWRKQSTSLGMHYGVRKGKLGRVFLTFFKFNLSIFIFVILFFVNHVPFEPFWCHDIFIHPPHPKIHFNLFPSISPLKESGMEYGTNFTWTYVFNRPGVAGAVLQTALSLINSLIESSFPPQFSRHHKSQTNI